MPASDRERLLKLIDGATAVRVLSSAPEQTISAATADPTAPLARRPQAVFQLKERAAQVYDRVRAAVVSPEGDRRFPVFTAVFILAAAVVLFFGIDRWHMWSATREVTVAEGTQATSIRESLGLKLVGVDWSEVPVALVEDTVTGKTHFMRQGDSANGARVQFIFKDKVIFNTAKGRIALR